MLVLRLAIAQPSHVVDLDGATVVDQPSALCGPELRQRRKRDASLAYAGLSARLVEERVVVRPLAAHPQIDEEIGDRPVANRRYDAAVDVRRVVDLGGIED